MCRISIQILRKSVPNDPIGFARKKKQQQAFM